MWSYRNLQILPIQSNQRRTRWQSRKPLGKQRFGNYPTCTSTKQNIMRTTNFAYFCTIGYPFCSGFGQWSCKSVASVVNVGNFCIACPPISQGKNDAHDNEHTAASNATPNTLANNTNAKLIFSRSLRTLLHQDNHYLGIHNSKRRRE